MRHALLIGLLATALACSKDDKKPGGTPPAADRQAPTFVALTPADNATNVPASIQIVFTFSEAMAAGSFTASSLTLTGPQGPVAGQIAVGGNSAVLTPNAPLADGTAYTASVTTAVTDVAGNALAAAASGSFTTGVTGVSGLVLDLAGNGIADVGVAGGGLNVSTGVDGTFDLALSAGPGQVVQFTKPGLVANGKQVEVFPGVSSYLRVVMMAEAAPISLNADTGGTVAGARGAEITTPTSAFVDGTGAVVTGNVQVSLTPYDPAIEEEAAAYPGDLLGSTLAGGTVTLITQGVLDIAVRSPTGESLQIAPGKTIDLRIPAPSAGDKPATTQLWYYDEALAIWVEVDHAATYDLGTNSYAGTVDHLTSYNADRAIDPSCVNSRVQYADGRPAIGVEVTAQQGYVADPHWNRGVYARTTTDMYGGFCVTAEREEMVLIRVFDRDGTITERTFRANDSRSDDYPEDCAEPSCKSLPAIVLGTADPGELSGADCTFDVGTNPFGTCPPMAAFYECFAPEGACTFETTVDMGGATESTMVYENGSTMVTTVDPITGKAETKVHGPDPFNPLCGEVAQDGAEMVITNADGAEVRIRTSETGTMELNCYGMYVPLTPEQQSALLSCNPDSGTGGGVACEAAPGTFDAPCTFDNDCNAGLECCGPIGEQQKCYTTSMCVAYDLSCELDNECLGRGPGYVCCSAGYFDMCLPPEACQ